ncbi:hypothetical protein AB0K34_05000 [Actinomadura sp. NPDC049382]|uniref:hypothetical protein n=1 Tax=Actinomadura sp. NPDC049382 TaxID=3158220 RepID=UPI00343D7D11
MTYTRTHTFITFANPYLTCEQCGAWVKRWHSNDQCGCTAASWNDPCGCEHAGTTSACPSWGPDDGCQCAQVLGRVNHGEPR